MKGLSKGRYDETFAGEDVILVTNTIVAESILFVWLFRAAHDLTSWPSG